MLVYATEETLTRWILLLPSQHSNKKEHDRHSLHYTQPKLQAQPPTLPAAEGVPPGKRPSYPPTPTPSTRPGQDGPTAPTHRQRAPLPTGGSKPPRRLSHQAAERDRTTPPPGTAPTNPSATSGGAEGPSPAATAAAALQASRDSPQAAGPPPTASGGGSSAHARQLRRQ